MCMTQVLYVFMYGIHTILTEVYNPDPTAATEAVTKVGSLCSLRNTMAVVA